MLFCGKGFEECVWQRLLLRLGCSKSDSVTFWIMIPNATWSNVNSRSSECKKLIKSWFFPWPWNQIKSFEPTAGRLKMFSFWKDSNYHGFVKFALQSNVSRILGKRLLPIYFAPLISVANSALTFNGSYRCTGTSSSRKCDWQKNSRCTNGKLDVRLSGIRRWLQFRKQCR